MSDGVHDLLEVHACACNGRVLETLRPWWAPEALCECDGELVGEGPDAISRTLASAWGEGLIGRVVEMDGGRVLMACDGPEGQGRPRLIVRLRTGEDAALVTACSVEHVD